MQSRVTESNMQVHVNSVIRRLPTPLIEINVDTTTTTTIITTSPLEILSEV